MTWAVHSSVASVLLIMSLAYAQFISPFAALALVLGANLGSAINPVFEGARRDNPGELSPAGRQSDQPDWSACCWWRRCCSPITERYCRAGSLTSPR